MLFFRCAGLVALSSLPLAVQAAPVTWAIADGGNGHSYEIVTGEFSWDAALAGAAAMTLDGTPGYLATITSQEEQDFLNIMTGGQQRLWLGGSDGGTEGEWIWADGPEAGQLISSLYENWGPGEPNDLQGEDALVGWWDGNDQWNDWDGVFTISYLVEFDAAPDTGGGNSAAIPLPASGLLLLGAFGLLALRSRLT